MILGMNNFSFNGQHFLQTHATAMDTRMAPSYANLFVGNFEQLAIENAPLKPFVWWRYIDDIFIIWTEGEHNLKTFIDYLNSIHPTIKFTHEYSNSSNQSLPFLDVHLKVIPEFCIAHSYCARFLRHQRAHMSPRAYKTEEISFKLSSIAREKFRFY